MSSSLPNAQVWTNFSGDDYHKARLPYPIELLQQIVRFHKSTSTQGGRSTVAVDLGCGPGTVTVPLAAEFDKVYGVDIAAKMYLSAPTVPNVQYQTASASSLPFLEDGSVDLVTAGTSAHWFDHPAWWKEMSRIVRPGGTVAVWTFGPCFVSNPDQDETYPPALENLLKVTQRYAGPLQPYRTTGNKLTYELYDTLPGPSSASDLSIEPRWTEEASRKKWGWESEEAYVSNEKGYRWNVIQNKEGLLGEKGEQTTDEDKAIERTLKSRLTLNQLATFFASVSPIIAYRANLQPDEPDWIDEQFRQIYREGASLTPDGSEWNGETVIGIRRVLSVVVWKKKD
ncbi:Methyltransferase [Phaffia rhodozyma]|uniref:Methyltransferase n=1 Tax=Phaffia rhodozyma TaxID=264483 RepID=A0A0F7SIF0_PHARH|nr:Methyltransferase [Phaffia rhodozyma]